MAGDSDDLDAALDSLSAESESALASSTREEMLPQGPPRPPPAKKGKRPRDLPTTRRVPFDELFVSASTPVAAVHGSPEEKIAYLREKLRHAEDLTTRFREAWEVREKEMDAFEVAANQAREVADEALSERDELQAFIDKKQRELEAYGQKVSAAFAERETLIKTLRAEKESLEAKLDEAAHRAAALRGEFKKDRQRALGDRDLRINELEEQLDEARSEIAALEDELRAARRDLEAPRPSAQGSQRNEADVARLHKALKLTTRLAADLAVILSARGDPDREAIESLGRLRKALQIARKAAELV
jgi:DNA repair exonuclease SbcCD ATPase subunit